MSDTTGLIIGVILLCISGWVVVEVVIEVGSMLPEIQCHIAQGE